MNDPFPVLPLNFGEHEWLIKENIHVKLAIRQEMWFCRAITVPKLLLEQAATVYVSWGTSWALLTTSLLLVPFCVHQVWCLAAIQQCHLSCKKVPLDLKRIQGRKIGLSPQPQFLSHDILSLKLRSYLMEAPLWYNTWPSLRKHSARLPNAESTRMDGRNLCDRGACIILLVLNQAGSQQQHQIRLCARVSLRKAKAW